MIKQNHIKIRLINLDILRGLSILLVFFYHLFHSMSNEFFIDKIDSFVYKVFTPGSIGVNLFFLISGFVIIQSLYTSKNILFFFKKRWIRLFPSMLLCSIIIILITFFTSKDIDNSIILNLLISIFFIDPIIVNKYFNTSLEGLSGVFWTLYVEVKFYILAACIFKFTKKNLKHFIGSFYIFYLLIKYLNIYFPNVFLFNSLYQIGMNLSFAYFCWFASGIYFYYYYYENKKNDLIFFFFFSFLSCLHISRLDSIAFFTIGLAIFLLFFFSFNHKILKYMIGKNFFIFFGLISYELYLIHITLFESFALYLYSYFNYFITILLLIFLSVLSAYLIFKCNNFIKKL